MGFIRLILAITVVITHSAPVFGIKLSGGQTAVQSFFVISGFYMQMVLTRKYIPASEPTWRTFIVARLARLMPLYWIVLFLALISALAGVNTVVAGDQLRGINIEGLSVPSVLLLGVTQIFLVGQDVLMFVAFNDQGNPFFTSNFHDSANPAYSYLLIAQAWTVALELTFYILAPWLAKLRSRWIVLLMCLSLTIRFSLAVMGHYQDPWSYRFFPSELLFFLAGMLAFRNAKFLKEKMPSWKILLSVLLVAWLAFPVLAGLLPGGNLVLPWLYALALALTIPSIFEATKKSPIDRWMGEFSYPVYLSHVLTISLVALVYPEAPAVLVLLAVILVGYVLVRIDRPLEARREAYVASRTGRIRR